MIEPIGDRNKSVEDWAAIRDALLDGLSEGGAFNPIEREVAEIIRQALYDAEEGDWLAFALTEEQMEVVRIAETRLI